MSIKTVENIIKPREPHFVGDGFRVHNFIPSTYQLDMSRMNPFVLLDYNSKYYFPPTDTPRGVSVHPHRGIETVTIVYEGSVAHNDSSGGGGIIRKGDIQWMTSGSGILHKEYHEKEWARKGGIFHVVQLWINLPTKEKMSRPKYQSLLNKNLQSFDLPNNEGCIKVIAGDYKGIDGIAFTFTPIYMYNVELIKNAKADFSFPSDYNTSMLIIEGSIIVNDKDIAPTDNFVLMANDGEDFEIKSLEDSKILVLSGENLNEPIAARGPFVMNTKEEISQAYLDFKTGKFGFLED